MSIKAAGFRYIPQGAVKIADKKSDAVAYLYEQKGAICGRVYYGAQSKPVMAYRFASAAKREAEIVKYFRYRQEAMARKEAQRAKRKATGRGVEVGQFMSSSWGYDQTQVDFYRVEKLIGKTMAELVKVGAISVEEGNMCGKVIPGEKPLKDAKPFRVVVKDGGAKVNGYYASVWDGMPKYVSSYA